MAARTKAANTAKPKVDESAYVHSFSRLIGDVKVGANVFVAPGSSIRADEGTPFFIGENSNIQDGVVIHGLEQGRVVGKDNRKYSVWIGRNTCITHMALIHGPAYIGDDCFIGFRSTVFNAKVGNGCIIMMHALIQDVEIPPGKYVPSGAKIVNQQQAEDLPNAIDRDRDFADRVVEINQALVAGYRRADEEAYVNPPENRVSKGTSANFNSDNYRNDYTNSVSNMSLSTDIRSQVRSLLAQGCIISTEHATRRRFKVKSWQTGERIESRNEGQVMTELESVLREYQGQYVRLIGVDPRANRRVVETIVQRPEDTPGEGSVSNVVNHNRGRGGRNRSSHSGRSNGSGNLNGDVANQINSLVSQGCGIGIERASQRRFKTKSWLTVGQVDGSANKVFGAIEQAMSEYPNEYVRIVGVDNHAKRRMAEIIVQRPGEDPVQATRNWKSSSNGNGSRSSYSSNGSGSLGSDVASQISSLVNQGCGIGIERASQRRFKTKSWLTVGQVDGSTNKVFGAIEQAMTEYPNEYVRIVGVDNHAKRRMAEIIVQRPGEDPVQATRNWKSSNGNGSRSSYSSNGNGGSGSLGAKVIQEIRSLLAAGFKIGTEHADKRRFRTKSWKSCSPIESNRESDVIAALEHCLDEHSNEYVRMLGIDAQHKRRVAETIIQRPGDNSNGNGNGNGNGHGNKNVDDRGYFVADYTNDNSKNNRPAHYNRFSQKQLSADAVRQVRSLLAAGYRIGTEHADKRRFKARSWKSCSPIESRNELDVVASLKVCLAEHSGEYVKLLGIDPKNKKRVAETIIQRP